MTLLESLLNRAALHRWCTDATRARCTPDQFITELREIRSVLHDGFLSDFCRTEPSVWYDLHDWKGALRIAFEELSLTEREEVLQNWLPRLAGHVRIIDTVLFYVVRQPDISTEVQQRWLTTAVEIALEFQDPSLMETLLYSLGPRMRDYPKLAAAAVRLGGNHPGVRKAVKRVLHA